MNLLMYRMEDTERLRSKMRERRRQEVFEKAEMEEEKEKNVFARVERNRRWRARKEGRLAEVPEESEEDDKEESEKDDKEQRRVKNMEWRRRRSTAGSQVELTTRILHSNILQVEVGASAPAIHLSSLLLTELLCPFCQVLGLGAGGVGGAGGAKVLRKTWRLLGRSCSAGRDTACVRPADTGPI